MDVDYLVQFFIAGIVSGITLTAVPWVAGQIVRAANKFLR